MTTALNSSIQTQIRTIDGISVRFAQSEARETDALLLSPWPESVFSYEPTWSRLAEHTHLVAIDLPGFGHSERRDDLMSPRAMGEFITRAADAFGLEQPHVVGPDIGTAASLFAAAEHPGRFKSLVVGTGTPRGPQAAKEHMTPLVSANAAPTQFVETKRETYAYRRFGDGPAPSLVFLQHFTGTLDNWDPAVTDPLARGRDLILFESAGLGRSTGEVPDTILAMTAHLLAFVDALNLTQVDLLGFSLGGMVAQQAALERPSLVRKMLLVGTAPEGGEDIMHLEKPVLQRVLDDPNIRGLQKLVGLFFTPSESSQAAGRAFVARLAARKEDREPAAGPNVAQAQIAAFRAWERLDGDRFAKLHQITQPCLVVNGVFDNMIPVRNSYALAEHLPRAMLLTYPDAGHGSLFQFHESFVRQASLFLDTESF